LIGGWHFVWSLLVGIGWAQPIIDFAFWPHMIKPVYAVKPLDALAAVTLVMLTSVIGCLLGSVGPIIWSQLHRH
jgi:Mg/Co/Ni transporter MgtE